jgi:FKBP-type peptidyl-prolyl cis-trans isomerase
VRLLPLRSPLVFRPSRLAAPLALALALVVASCGGQPDAPPRDDGTVGLEPPEDLSQADTAFSLAFAIELPNFERRPSGLYVREVEGGRAGAVVRPGNTVAVRYAGYLANGREFDGSARNGRLLRFVVGQHRVIDGLEEGVTGMHVHGRRRLVIPPSLGYGKAGRPGMVPSRSTLVFDVEVVEVR